MELFFVVLARTEALPWSYYKHRKWYYTNFKYFILIWLSRMFLQTFYSSIYCFPQTYFSRADLDMKTATRWKLHCLYKDISVIISHSIAVWYSYMSCPLWIRACFFFTFILLSHTKQQESSRLLFFLYNFQIKYFVSWLQGQCTCI